MKILLSLNVFWVFEESSANKVVSSFAQLCALDDTYIYIHKNENRPEFFNFFFVTYSRMTMVSGRLLCCAGAVLPNTVETGR